MFFTKTSLYYKSGILQVLVQKFTQKKIFPKIYDRLLADRTSNRFLRTSVSRKKDLLKENYHKKWHEIVSKWRDTDSHVVLQDWVWLANICLDFKIFKVAELALHSSKLLTNITLLICLVMFWAWPVKSWDSKICCIS